MRAGVGGSRQRPAVKAGEQLPFPGMAPSELPDPKAVVGQGSDPLRPPSYLNTEPVIFKEEGGKLSPFQKAQLDDQQARTDRIVVDNEVKRGEIRDRDERRDAELERGGKEFNDRRIERYVFLAIFLLSALAAVAISPGTPVAISILAGLRLRALTKGDRTTIWDWLIRRRERK